MEVCQRGRAIGGERSRLSQMHARARACRGGPAPRRRPCPPRAGRLPRLFGVPGRVVARRRGREPPSPSPRRGPREPGRAGSRRRRRPDLPESDGVGAQHRRLTAAAASRSRRDRRAGSPPRAEPAGLCPGLASATSEKSTPISRASARPRSPGGSCRARNRGQAVPHRASAAALCIIWGCPQTGIIPGSNCSGSPMCRLIITSAAGGGCAVGIPAIEMLLIAGFGDTLHYGCHRVSLLSFAPATRCGGCAVATGNFRARPCVIMMDGDSAGHRARYWTGGGGTSCRYEMSSAR